MTEGNIAVEKLKALWPERIRRCEEFRGDTWITLKPGVLVEACPPAAG